MTDKVPALTDPPEGYADWLADLKSRIHAAQQRAALVVNTGLLRLYWQIGRDIIDRQAEQGWGSKVVERLAHDLREAFPDLGGFSRANLMYMRAFAEVWPEDAIVQQPVGQIPGGHNIVLLTKLKDNDLRLGYAAATVEHGWARNILTMQIEVKAIERQGKAVTNGDAEVLLCDGLVGDAGVAQRHRERPVAQGGRRSHRYSCLVGQAAQRGRNP